MIFLKLNKKTLELILDAEGYTNMECIKDLDKMTKILKAEVTNRRLKTVRDNQVYRRQK
jgi:hypothetical protein